jgi:hypothetical protein
MAFHLSPFDARVRQFFCGSPEGLLRPRVPLAKRAATQSRERGFRPEEIKRSLRMPSFSLGSNQIVVSPGFPDEDYLYQLISHLGSLFSGARLSFKHWDKGLDPLEVTFEAVDLSLQEPLVKAVFSRSEGFLNIDYLRGSRPGYAGRTLVALYNIAKEQKLREIDFSLCPENLGVLQFHFHMDFGRYLEEVPERWIITL